MFLSSVFGFGNQPSDHPTKNDNQSIHNHTNDNPTNTNMNNTTTSSSSNQKVYLTDKCSQSQHFISEYMIQMVNDASVGLYRIQEHVQKKVPQLVEEKKNIQKCIQDLELVQSDTSDSLMALNQIYKHHRFTECQSILSEIKKM